jgi:hypothetical protein
VTGSLCTVDWAVFLKEILGNYASILLRVWGKSRNL